MSLRLRLTLWYSGILAVTLLAFGIGVYFFQYISTYKKTYRIICGFNRRKWNPEFNSNG